MIAPGLSNDELIELQELQEVHNLTTMPGWKTRILPLLNSLVSEANEEMLGAVFATVEVKASLLTRWQQRVAVQRAVLGYIDECSQRRTRILEEIKEREKIAAGDSSGVPIEEYA